MMIWTLILNQMSSSQVAELIKTSIDYNRAINLKAALQSVAFFFFIKLLCIMKYIEVSVVGCDNLLHEILVAEMAEIGFESFDDTEGGLKAYIQLANYGPALMTDILDRYGISIIEKEIEQENWNSRWEENFQPVTVGTFCTIRADFHEPAEGITHDIIITPKMSFGTGHHATTRMMVERMSEIAFSGCHVLDFGTGTGVLAILAERLGASEVMAIDNDDWSVENTIENIERNNSLAISVQKGSLEVVSGVYNVILANINRHILMQYMDDMAALLHKDGQILMSGILVEDETMINAKAGKCGLKQLNRKQLDKWICLSYAHL